MHRFSSQMTWMCFYWLVYFLTVFLVSCPSGFGSRGFDGLDLSAGPQTSPISPPGSPQSSLSLERWCEFFSCVKNFPGSSSSTEQQVSAALGLMRCWASSFFFFFCCTLEDATSSSSPHNPVNNFFSWNGTEREHCYIEESYMKCFESASTGCWSIWTPAFKMRNASILQKSVCFVWSFSERNILLRIRRKGFFF